MSMLMRATELSFRRHALMFGAAMLGLGAIPTVSATTVNENFNAATSQITYNGSASQDLSNGWGVLTPDALGQAGSLWFNTPFATSSFSVSFDFFVGTSTGGADGITFSVIDTGLGLNALGSGGGGLGFFDIGGPSFAVEFDTFENGFDPNGNHVGALGDSGTGPALGPTATAIPVLEDGQVHSALLSFNAGLMQIFLDGANVLNVGYPGAYIPSTAYFGFTGGTGALSNLQYVDNVVINATAVSEPVTLGLLGLGIAGLGFSRRNAK